MGYNQATEPAVKRIKVIGRHISLVPQMMQRVDNLAKENGLGTSETIRQIITDYFERKDFHAKITHCKDCVQNAEKGVIQPSEGKSA